MTDYKELLDELRSKWLFPRNIEAADLIERLIRERDEAKRERDEALEYTQAIRDHCMKERDEARAKAIDEASEMTPEKWDYVQSRLKDKP